MFPRVQLYLKQRSGSSFLCIIGKAARGPEGADVCRVGSVECLLLWR